MVLESRPIAPVTVDLAVLSASPAALLDATEGARLVGLLAQIGQLSDYAAQIFTGLYEDATVVAERTRKIKSRVAALDTLVPQVIQRLESAPPASFYTQSNIAQTFVRVQAPHVEQLHPSTRPAEIEAARAAANPPPNLSLLDPFAGKQCALGYSDPSFFLNHWIRQQEENMAKSAQDNKAKKEKRRKKREAKVVEAVQQLTIKTYSAQGKEFESMTPSNKQPQLVPVSQLQTSTAPRQSQASIREVEEEQRIPQPTFVPVAPSVIVQQQPHVMPIPVQTPAAPVPPPFTHVRMPSFHEQPEEPPVAPSFHEPPTAPVDVPPPVHVRAPSTSVPPSVHVRAPSISSQNITPVRAPPPPPSQSIPPPPPPRTPQFTSVVPPSPTKIATPPPPPQAPTLMRTPPPPPAGLPVVPPPMSPPFGADAPEAPPMAPSFSAPEAPAFTSADAPPPPPPPSFDAPPAPPAFSSAPSAPAPPRPRPAAATAPAGGRDALLDAIQGGVKLRKAAPEAAAAAAPVPERSGLLGEIKNRNFQLRSVDRTKVEEEKKTVAPPVAAGGLNSIMDVLARRQAIVGDDSDSDSDNDDWET